MNLWLFCFNLVDGWFLKIGFRLLKGRAFDYVIFLFFLLLYSKFITYILKLILII